MIKLFGILLGFLLIIIGIAAEAAPIYIYFNLSGLAIVLGGTIAATLVSFPFKEVTRAFNSYVVVFKSGTHDYIKAIDQMLKVIKKHNIGGITSLEEVQKQPKNLWLLFDGIQMMINGYDKNETKLVLEDQIHWKNKREYKQTQLFSAMGKFSPAFGIVGTLIGLINILSSLENSPKNIGIGLAIALTSALYGLILANIIFKPISEKLQERAENNLLLETMQLETILMIYDNNSFNYALDRLSAYICVTDRKKILMINQNSNCSD